MEVAMENDSGAEQELPILGDEMAIQATEEIETMEDMVEVPSIEVAELQQKVEQLEEELHSARQVARSAEWLRKRAEELLAINRSRLGNAEKSIADLHKRVIRLADERNEEMNRARWNEMIDTVRIEELEESLEKGQKKYDALMARYTFAVQRLNAEDLASVKALEALEKDEDESDDDEEDGDEDTTMFDEDWEWGSGSSDWSEVDETLFLNKTFILTSANRTTSGVIFKKNEMKKWITERGGTTEEDITQIPLDAEAYLISDAPYRTHKYLYALARDMPCVSHLWLKHCVENEELKDYKEYLLPAGPGLLDGELYELQSVKGKLLAGLSFMVHSALEVEPQRGVPPFGKIWSPIIELLGGTVVPHSLLAFSAGGDSELDCGILLTNSTCPSEVVQMLEAAGNAVVSSEWLIQSIITGKCPDFKAHPRFCYDSGVEHAKLPQS